VTYPRAIVERKPGVFEVGKRVAFPAWGSSWIDG